VRASASVDVHLQGECVSEWMAAQAFCWRMQVVCMLGACQCKHVVCTDALPEPIGGMQLCDTHHRLPLPEHARTPTHTRAHTHSNTHTHTSWPCPAARACSDAVLQEFFVDRCRTNLHVLLLLEANESALQVRGRFAGWHVAGAGRYVLAALATTDSCCLLVREPTNPCFPCVVLVGSPACLSAVQCACMCVRERVRVRMRMRACLCYGCMCL